MSKLQQFHGSDLEAVARYFHLPQEEIICFGANVNPLGLSSSVKNTLAEHLEIISSYPDRDYSSLKNKFPTIAMSARKISLSEMAVRNLYHFLFNY